MRRWSSLVCLLLLACKHSAKSGATDSDQVAASSAPALPIASSAAAPPSMSAMPAPSASVPSVAHRDDSRANHTLPPARELAELAARTNAFGFDLFAKIRARQGNLAMSPASLAAALAMAAGGAKSSTAAEMKRVLHLVGVSDPTMMGDLLTSLQSRANQITIRAANCLFGDQGYAFDERYLARTRATFGGALEALDFQGAPEKARLFINGWIADKTGDRIKDLLPGGSIDGETRLVLANAIYFLGDWEKPFEQRKTKEASFHAPAGAPRSVPTMHALEHFSFAAAHGVEVLDLPYLGGELSMTLVLPDRVDGLDVLESTIKSASLGQWTALLEPRLVEVSLPKFAVDPAQPIALARELSSLGMQHVFQREKADFTGMTRTAETSERLFMSQVFHKAFVKLDEKGTEAAAASGASMALASAPAATEKPAEFRADHPFLFFLRDRLSGLILFMGRVSEPSGG